MRGTLHHIDITVRDVAASAPFYEPILEFLGHTLVKREGDIVVWDLMAGDQTCGVAIRAAHSMREHDRYTAGLHHLAWRAESRAAVDELYVRIAVRRTASLRAPMRELNITVLDAPADYPQYGEGYYAVFFADPDGLKLEFVHFPQ
jgi:glyoxylase I family protein